jgi:hypothetical protein
MTTIDTCFGARAKISANKWLHLELRVENFDLSWEYHPYVNGESKNYLILSLAYVKKYKANS